MPARKLLPCLPPKGTSFGAHGRLGGVERSERGASVYSTPARPAVAHSAPSLINPRASGSQTGFFAP